jgi:exopolysaccharide biosynthesis polyprenyl glycosylphosphotransferase
VYNRRESIYQEISKLLDLLVMIIAFGLATIVVFYHDSDITLENFLFIRIKLYNFILFFGILFVWLKLFSFFELHDLRHLADRRGSIRKILKATTACTILLEGVDVCFNIALITPLFLLVFWISSTVLAMVTRLLCNFILALMKRRGKYQSTLVIVGTNPRAVRLAQRIRENPELGYQVAGFVDNLWEGIEEFRRSRFALLCNFDDFPGYLREHVVDEVLICLPLNSLYAQAAKIVALCEEQGIILSFLSDFFPLNLPQGGSRQEFAAEKVMTVIPGYIKGWQALIKRVFDLGFSSIVLLAVAPLFAIISLLIKFSSPGPVFFVQERIGLNKRKFRLYKFRTMVVDAEKKQDELAHLNEMEGPVFKIKNDPRVTKLGKFFRKTSLDELPQLLNVLKGDLSLVGPRPLPVRDYNGFSQDWQRRRFSVLPGITCLWQVNGRNNIPFEKWMKLDLEYIDHWSLWLDFQILIKTIPAMFRGSGAA